MKAVLQELKVAVNRALTLSSIMSLSLCTPVVVSLCCLLSSAGLSDVSKQYGSWKLLTVQKDLMVVCCSSPNTPPTLVRQTDTNTHTQIKQRGYCH